MYLTPASIPSFSSSASKIAEHFPNAPAEPSYMNQEVQRITARNDYLLKKLLTAGLPPELLGAKVPPFQASLELHRFMSEFQTVEVPDGVAEQNTELWVEHDGDQQYVLPNKSGGISLFLPFNTKSKKSFHSMDIGAGLECRRSEPSLSVPQEIVLHQDGYHPDTVDRPYMLHFTARPATRMLRNVFEGAFRSFLSIQCRPAASRAEHVKEVLNWDRDDPWPPNKSCRVALQALQQLGQSTTATPQQGWMCWLLYHDIKQCGFTIDSYLNHDSTAGRTLAAALQHLETNDIYSRMFADNIIHALSKVLIGYTPQYLNNPPDIYSDSDSEVGC